MSVITKDLGAATAYAYAVEKGYTGTEEEFAELMASYADVGQTAVDAKDAAVAAKTAAQTAATTATNKATEATTAATTATTKAGEASTSASTATSAKDTAVSASQTATTKATEATTAAGTATTAKNDAVSAKTAAETAQVAAETAQGAAEDAAESVSASAEQIATNTSDISDLKSGLNGSIENLNDGKLKIAPTFVFGTLDTNGDLISFSNNSRCVSAEYYSAVDGDVLTLDSGYSMILCEYDTAHTLLARGIKSSGTYPLTDGHLYRVCIFSVNQTIQNTPYDYAFKAHLQSEIDKKIESVNNTVSGLNSDISNLENSQVISVIVPDVTYHNDGYVNASTNVITSIAQTAEYFYSDLIQLYANDVVTVNYRDTLDVVWILSKWTDANTFDSGILKGNSNTGVQTYSFTASNNMYIRHSARYLNDITIKRANGDNIEVVSNAVATDLGVVDYGYLLNSFLKIGAVGDSLASGECISNNTGTAVSNDLYEHSWLQYMARFYGFTGINFSKGGMTTRGWLFDDDYNQQGWTKAQIAENKCNAYIIGLGANDMALMIEDASYLGSPSDIGTTNPTFYRYYSQIISRLKTIQPKAKFFLFTLTWLYTETPPYNAWVDRVNEAITYIANNTENCYLIDLDADRWYYGTDVTGNRRSGHYNAISYNMQAMHLAKLIGKYIHDNQSEFRQVEFIGTDLSWNQ